MKKQEENQEAVDATKREFMKKFGAYAASAPVGMYILMTPAASANATSSVNAGGGSTTDSAGNSCPSVLYKGVCVY